MATAVQPPIPVVSSAWLPGGPETCSEADETTGAAALLGEGSGVAARGAASVQHGSGVEQLGRSGAAATACSGGAWTEREEEASCAAGRTAETARGAMPGRGRAGCVGRGGAGPDGRCCGGGGERTGGG
jgi:hypothetical protein